MTVTEAVTSSYEHDRQAALGTLTAQEQAANALLDGAAQTEPARASRALHVAMYAARIGQCLNPDDSARRLWLLGVLSVLAPDGAVEYSVFADYRPEGMDLEILRVAQAFEAGVEKPAETMRFMFARPERFNRDAVSALRLALRRVHSVSERVESVAKGPAQRCG